MKLNNFWKTSALIFCILCTKIGVAQSYSWVYFTDKCTDSAGYFSSPVCSSYIDSLKALNIEVIGTSKWLNAACVKNSEALNSIDEIDFVSYCEPLQRYTTKEA